MGQKSSRFLFAIDYRKNWLANWFAVGKEYSDFALEDMQIRKYLSQFDGKYFISRVSISRLGKSVEISILSARPVSIIGNPDNISSIKTHLTSLTGKDVSISVKGVKRPELDASIIGLYIANHISSGSSYKKSVKLAVQNSMKFGALGVKIVISGRLNGAEIARSEVYKDGSIPLHTIRANIDYSCKVAATKYGNIGIKVWVHIPEKFS